MADPTKRIAGLAKTGGAVISGQVAATVITNQALRFGGGMTAPGTVGHKVGSVALPVVLGAIVMGVSKKEAVQNAGIGAVTAGVAAATDLLLGDNRPQFYPGDAGKDYAAGILEPADDALAGFERLPLPPAAALPPPIQLVDAGQLS